MIIIVLIVVVLIVVGILIPAVSLQLWCIASLIVLVWGMKNVTRFPQKHDSDYVDRYLKAQEDARLNTKAYLHQAYLHKDEIAQLNKLLNKK